MKKQTNIRYFTVLAVLLAAGMSGYWYSTGLPLPQIINIGFAILLAALPIPLWLSRPVALARGAKRAAKEEEILLAHPAVIAETAKLDTLVVAKDGIVTEGNPYIAALVPEGISQGALLGLAASAVRDSSNPLFQAIYRTAIERRQHLQRLSAANEFPGYGVEALINRSPLRVGKGEWLQQEGIEISANLLTKADQLAQRGQTTVFVANDKYCRGIIALADEIPQDNITAFHKLHRQKIKLIMLTGDSRRTANAVRKQAHLDEVCSNLSPQDKVREIQLLRAHGATMAMAGSLDSDTAAMAAADLSIHVGALPEEPAGDMENPARPFPMTFSIVLQSGKLWDLSTLIDISRKTMGIVKTNRFIAAVTWLILLPPALGLLHVFGGPFLPPFCAAAMQLTAAVLILLNSLRA
ncbi:Cu+-exporting ATPase [Selenomonas sp. GACV-9]|uniref:HAD-IC family P-type ATPase n=1 Tax=Selenomonas sp. GACV-9 TaxID=3158782 RepID=UPI0008E6D78F|nr:Cu+-exporting ATPase [Selenomonas ruminantium]